MTEPGGVPGLDERDRLRAVEALAEDPDAVPALVRVLADPSWRVRDAVVRELVHRGGADVVGAVLRALAADHQDLGVVNAAMQVLAQSGVDTIDPLIQHLTGFDADLRIYAALTLGACGDLRAVPALMHALEDPDTNVRFHAIEALKQLHATEAVDALAGVAESRDFFLAFPALDAIAALGDARVSFRIVPLLEDELLQGAVVEVLGRLGDEEVVGPLSVLLNQQGSPAAVIARALADIHGRYQQLYRDGDYVVSLVREGVKTTGVQNLLAALENAAPDTAPALARVLGWVGSDAADRVLTRLLARPTLRDHVIEALVRKGPGVTDMLIEQLKTGELETRQAAIHALGRIGDRRAVPALLRCLESEDGLAAEVAGSLAIIGDPRAYAPLLRLVGHPDQGLRRAVISAVNSLGHPDTPSDLAHLLTDPDPLVRGSAARIAGYAGFPNCADLLLERCRDEDEGVRRAAVESIASLDDPRTVPALRAVLDDPIAAVRAAAARTLGQMEGARVTALLLTALNDSDPWVRYFAARSAGQRADANTLELLCRLAQADPALQVRAAATESLGREGGSEALALLAQLAADPNPDLSRAALAALGTLQRSDALPPLLEAVRSPDALRRKEAVRALGLSRLPGAVEPLRQATGDAEPEAAALAVEALGHLATPEAIDALIDLSALPKWRETCISLLVRHTPDQAGVVARGLSHHDPNVRRALVEVLARQGSSGTLEALAPALADADGAVRRAAIAAVANACGRRAARRADKGGG